MVFKNSTIQNERLAMPRWAWDDAQIGCSQESFQSILDVEVVMSL